MKISFDPKYNIAYIRLRPKKGKVDTIHISDELNIDISSDGKIYGIEFLNANEQLQIKEEKFIFLNESTGKSMKFPLTLGSN